MTKKSKELLIEELHIITAYGDTPTLSVPFTANIIRRVHDHKIIEANKIAETAPPLNTDSGWLPFQLSETSQHHHMQAWHRS